MNRVFAIIAVGDNTYAQMALNLCLSIKSNSKIPVLLIHDGKSIVGMEERIRTHFADQICKTPPEGYPPMRHSSWLKIDLYSTIQEAGYEECVLLDADTIILPGKNIDTWFDQPQTFVPYTHPNAYDYATKQETSKKNYQFWCEPAKVKGHFCIADDSVMPQVNASFLYFRESFSAREIFNVAKAVWYDEGFRYFKYRGFKNEEPCFNIALAILNYRLERKQYAPIYFQYFSDVREEMYIFHHYKAFGMAGNIKHSPIVVSLYNKLSDYYRRQYGITEQFHFGKYTKARKGKRPLIGFWHIAMMNNWMEVVKEQLNLLNESGLLEESNLIHVGCVGSNDDARILSTILMSMDMNKFNILYYGTDLKVFEFPTMALLKDRCDDSKPFYGYYIHTKGVSYTKEPHKSGAAYWREFLNYYNIERWRDCQEKIQRGYDLCGVKLIPNGVHQMHYSGNFFHFDSNYVKTLAPIETLDKSDRFAAEMYICSGHPMAATLSQAQVDHFKQPVYK